ncbi:MAG: discoidin domain-containing protein [Deltaproteobacteria bacterium]|nr:discoidin domain-containing protein [Deltaproteobacteria bacterium]
MIPTTATTGHHDPTVLSTKVCLDCHTADPRPAGDCTGCHSDVGTAHANAECFSCHNNAMKSRRPIGPEFILPSHHVNVQAPAQIGKDQCKACHDLTAHMAGAVLLKDANGGASISYAGEASATPFCLSCHDEDHKTSQPFSDGLTPASSAWDFKSVGLKFNSTEVVSSNKYPPTAPAPNMAGQLYNTVPDVQRALSAHGNPAGNLANGSASDARVPCLACHNAHGSPSPSLLFSSATYQPASEEDFCWDCHTNAAASPHKAWDYLPNDRVRDYFGDSRWGMNDGTGFTVEWMGSFAYKDAPFKGSHFRPSKRKISDTNWPRSSVTCSSCHDPHGVDPNNAAKAYMVPLLKGTWLISPFKEDRAPLASYQSPLRDSIADRNGKADQPRSNPDLSFNNTPNPGSGYPNGTGGSGHEGYFIEDNTFGVWNPRTSAPAAAGEWRTVLSNSETMQINRIAETDAQFAGLCLQCHPKTSLLSGWTGHGTVKGWGGAKRDLIPSSLASRGGEEGPGNSMHAMGKYNSGGEDGIAYGRGYRWGVNPSAQGTSGYIQADYHQFTCSKCHSPHAAKAPRLLVTNCLDSKGNHTSYPKAKTAQAANCHSTQRNLAWNTLTPWTQTEAPMQYTIMATSTTGGTISPTGNVLVDQGRSQTFTMTPASSNFVLSYFRVDGVTQPAGASYTFTNVTADHTIVATFTSLNLAQGKTATASSTRSGTNPSYAASMAVDGSTTTSWMSSSTSSAQWVRVDLGSSQTLSVVQVAWPATYFAKNFQIQTSTDGTNFTTRYTGSNATGTVTYASFAAVSARYVRVYCTTPNNTSYYGVSELQAFASAPHNNAPTADAGPDKTGTVGTAISFAGSGTDSDGTVVGYSWSWGDGTADTNTQNASHTYAAVGTYTATLTVTDDRGATGSNTAVVTVGEPVPNSPPTANAGPDQTGTAGTAISFAGSGTDSDGTIVGYSWNWGDGTALTNTQNASHTYAAAGTYTATLTVTDNLGATGSDTAAVTVSAVPVNLALNAVATASSQSSSTYSAAKAVDGSTSTYWRSSSGGSQWLQVNVGSTASLSRVKVSWSSSYYARSFQIQTSLDGTNFVTQYSTSSGGSSPTDVSFPVVAARYARVYGTVANSSDYRITELEVYGTTVHNDSPIANAGSDKTGYAGSPISFTGSGTDPDGSVVGYSWSWGDGTAATNTQDASHTYAAAGMYTATLTVTDDLGAIGTDTAVVTVSAPPNSPPTANAGTDKTGTAGTAVSFTGSGTDSDGSIVGYSWNWGDGTAVTNTQNASHTYVAVGTYTATLTVTDNQGATGSDTALVTVSAAPPNQPPVANAGTDKTGTGAGATARPTRTPRTPATPMPRRAPTLRP